MAVNRKRTITEALENYIENPQSDGFSWIYLKKEFSEEDLQKEMKRIHGWDRHRAVQEGFEKRGYYGAEEVYKRQKWEMQRDGIL